MNIFKEVKDAVSAKEAASFYGLKVNGNGMCCCPFHNDKHPSMKIDKLFFCFGCGKIGDSIDFVSDYFGIKQKEAVEKIVQDFGLHINKTYKLTRKKDRNTNGKEKRSVKDCFDETKNHFWRILIDYHHLLSIWKIRHAPRAPEDEWNPFFSEALQNISQIEYVMDEFMTADLREQINIINDYGRKIIEYERKLEQYPA